MTLDHSSPSLNGDSVAHAPVRIGLVRDFRAENWPSMDLCADQLAAHLPTISGLTLADLETPFRRRFQRLPVVGRTNAAFNADRVINRHLVLGRFLRNHAAHFNFVHVVDHSYAHVVQSLPRGRTGVYCHDLDAFRSILEPPQERRPWWFKALARRSLRGLRMARVVFHNSQEVGRQLIAAGLVPAERLVHAPLGVADEFTPHAPALNPLADVELPSGPFLLHVGSQLPRKRIDVLLAVFAGVRKQLPGLRLIQVGPPLALRYVEQVHQLGIEADVQRFSNLQRRQLAELYRRAALVLVPSEAEGFGLPVIEALACGAPVLASAIPVLREVGGEAVLYRPVADIPAWVTAALGVLTDFTFAPARALRLAHASRYSWREHARVIGETYRRLAAFNNRKN